jgi:GT2 family glycosyltransferase
MQRVDPVRFTLGGAPPGLRVAVACVYRGKNADNLRSLLSSMPDQTVVRLWSLDGDVPDDLASVTIGTGPGHRFGLMNRLVSDIEPDARRDALLLVDDDVRFMVGDAVRLVVAARRSGFDLYQPAHTATSHANWRFVRRRALTFSRRTNFVEQGPLVGLSSRAQQVLLPLPEDLGMGWGVEIRWWAAALKHGLVQGIVDAAAIEHLGVTAQDYDRGPQEHSLANELRMAGLTDINVLQQTVRRNSLFATNHTESSRPLTTERAIPIATSPNGRPRLSVVVPTHHRRDQVLALVDAMVDDPAVFEIIVVVDGGTDDTFAALKVLANDVPVLRPVWQQHAGAGAARQNGVERARGDLVLLLDDDVEPEPGLATGHLAAHLSDPGRVVVGALPLAARRDRNVHSVVEEVYAVDYETCCADYRRNPATVLEHLWAGNISLERSQALSVGIRDAEFDLLFSSFEDRDLGLRIRAAGIAAIFREDLRATHHHRRTLRGYLRDSVRQGKAMVLLRDRYPAEEPEPTARQITGRFPPPTRLLVLLAIRYPNGVGRAITGALLFISHVTGLVHLRNLQRPFVVLLRRVGQARGVGIARRARHKSGIAPTT